MNDKFPYNLKVGDEVIYEFTVEHRLRRTILKVSRITDKQIVIEFGEKKRFAKKNCCELGGDGKLIETTPELLNEAREEMERRSLIIFCKNIKFDDLPTSALYGIEQIIEEDAK